MQQTRWVEGMGTALLVWELLFLALPVTAVDAFGLLWLMPPWDHLDYPSTLIGMVLASVALLGFWRLAFGFLLNGQSLRGQPRWARWSAGMGALLCLASLLVGMIFNRLTGWALIGVMGLPVLVPLGHMWVVSRATPRPPPLP